MDEQRSAFLDALHSQKFPADSGKIPFILGMDKNGNVFKKDLMEIPHLLIAGATGTGKSTLAHAILLSLVENANPDNLKLILCDTKIVEFGIYSGIPHLLIPVITCPGKIMGALTWACVEIGRRFKLMADSGVRSIDAYNDSAKEKQENPLPHILLVIDDIAAAMDFGVEQSAILNIAKDGRASGIHLMLITQSPGDKRLIEIFKNAIPARAAFHVFSDAEKRLLLGSVKKMPSLDTGEMLFCKAQSGVSERIRCFKITDAEINSVMSGVKERHRDYRQKNIQIEQDLASAGRTDCSDDDLEEDEMLPAVVDVVLETGQASVSMIQRRLKLGYARAARIVDEMEGKGIVGPFQGSKPRAILITKEQWQARKNSLFEIPFEEPYPCSYELSGEKTTPTPVELNESVQGNAEQDLPVTHRRRGILGILDSIMGKHKNSVRQNIDNTVDKTILINTEEEMGEFLEKHPLLDEFYTKVVGVTFNNDDGTSRQQILSKCKNGESVILRMFKYEGSPAFAVITDHGQIGCLSASLAQKIDSSYGDNIIFCGEISEVTGGIDGLTYGCNLHICVYEG